MKKIAVVLSGCGNKDGSEIHESVSLIVNLSKLGAKIFYFAPDVEFAPLNFLTDKPLTEKRNVLVESARIARSQIQDLQNLNVEEFDGLALPGGYGAAMQLSSWAKEGANCQVNAVLEKVIQEFHSQSKPIAAICIAPVLVAKVLGKFRVTLTIGQDRETVQELTKLGVQHEDCPVDDFVSDREHKIISTPAYMYKAQPHEVFAGIQGLSEELMRMA